MGVVATMANGMPLPPPNTAPPPDYLENGRLYHGYHKGSYMYPCDEQEMDRMDIFHKFFQIARRNKLHRKDFLPTYDAPRILDIGTGTGIWAIDMADKYPQTEVLGIDLSLIQPNTIPPNLSFRQRDFEGPWGLSVESWDLIHLRHLIGSVESWPELYSKVFMHLRPGYGFMEHVEIDFVPRCDDGSLPPTSSLNQWARYLSEATERSFKPLFYNHSTRHFLERQGFVDIEEEVIRIPFNPWPADSHQKDIGRWYNLGLCQGLEAFTLAPLTRVAHWKKTDVDRLLTEVKKEICSKKYHVYNNIHIWTARRPTNS